MSAVLIDSDLTYEVPILDILDVWNEVRNRIDSDVILNALANGDDTIHISDLNTQIALGLVEIREHRSESRSDQIHYTRFRPTNDGMTGYFCSCKGYTYHGHCWHLEKRPTG